MTTTDRMPNKDSRREAVDRVGETVILGNSVGSGALDAPARIVAADFGATSEATSNIDIDVTALLEMQNGSFGIWAVFADMDAAALFQAAGGTIRSANLAAAAAAALSFGTNGGGLINVRAFTATTGYTPTPGTVSVIVQCLGGGGGGGGSQATGVGQIAMGSGGGAGSYALARITSGFSGVTITIGAGGAGASAGANNGTAGGATSFGTLLIAGGGSGGAFHGASATIPAARYGSSGGSSSGSQSLFASAGARGRTAYCLGGLVSGGAGAPSVFGMSGVEAETAGSSVAGGAASGYGAGGGGAAATASQVARGGGNGAPGICIVWEYNT